MFTNLFNRSALLPTLSLLVLSASMSFASGRDSRSTGPNPLPQTPPAPDIIYRESFGQAELMRPTGSKGQLRATNLHTPIQDFWIEYPGSKATRWIAPSEGQTWRLCVSSDNPYEMYSPIQMTLGYYTNGCAMSEWFDIPTQNPAALMTYTAPASAYEINLNGYPAPIAGKYLALGLTDSSATYSNLATVGNVVLVIKPAPPYMNFTILYELRIGGMDGQLLAAGETYFEGFNQMKLRVDPISQTVSASVNGTELGPFAVDIGTPRYVGFEGVAIADNFFIRTLN